MAAAFEELYGRGDVFDGFDFGGMTDFRIVRAALTAVGGAVEEATFQRVLEVYLRHLEDQVPKATSYRVLPGVRELLEALSAHADLAVGLGTGNVQRGAEIKLTRGGIMRYFAFGGFGSDHEHRAELLRAGAERGAARLRTSLAACRLVIVGDTPKDVEAARELDAECIGVGTGGHAARALISLGATAAFEDLGHPDVLPAILRA
jgi:phosphoglycolate phosphatase-like HAD superfamily hydrolase